MSEHKKEHVEEISAEEIEVISSRGESSEETPKVRKISADASYSPGDNGNPLGNFSDLLEEWKKLKFFGILALVLSLIGISFSPLYFSSLAILFALLDFWKGSRLTHKLSWTAIILALLTLL